MGPAPTSVRRVRLPAQIAEGISELVASGALRPGDRLPTEDALARSFGVGRNSLREGIRQLEMLGVVEVLQGDGTFVRSPSADTISMPFRTVVALSSQSARMVLEFRSMLEPGIAALAAERATPEQVELLASLHAKKLKLQRSKRSRAVLEADLDFHLALAAATNNPIAHDIAQALVGLLRDFRLRLTRRASFSRELTDCEGRVLAAVAAHDPAAASRAMEEHMAILAPFLPGADAPDRRKRPAGRLVAQPAGPVPSRRHVRLRGKGETT